ncbi:uncharacterized protein LOC101900104 isoform X2 [Musca domestica]|uniref:Uncharacterized protein LOC101900104 isoform X2 n=2 Tax=Musca domestica TaxID=7370 RepID=A0A9J7D9U4_MUSDO|nr:uncharacterized protein LOC101900104 isoform X2 [Musca domestica]
MSSPNAQYQRPMEYLVWNENCHIPSMDPFAAHYMKNYKEEIGPICSTKPALVSKSFNNSTKLYSVKVHMEFKHLYLKGTSTDDDIKCCYRQVLRRGDQRFNLLECKQFDQFFTVPGNIDYMLVSCVTTRDNILVYEDGLTFIQNRKLVNEKLRKSMQQQRQFGILLIGIDSLSQFNVRRVMPRTFKYVENEDWFELSGYNKIDDNTFPNIMAIFTGMNLETAQERCHYDEEGGLDNCTTLFNWFKEQDFATAYSEDACWMSTFDYLKPGFMEPPTDYYQRPLLLAIEEKLQAQELSGLKYCIGPRRYGEYVYDFGVEFAERYLGKSIFGLFWTNSFSHNDWIDPATMDERMVEYFKYMDKSGIFDNNIVIFFSDHGARWGFLRGQKEGYVEERLPMFFMRVPQWFQTQHPDIVEALRLNKNRLTSPYDVHVTLKHLALLSLGRNGTIELPSSCPTCQTLLQPVPHNRTCSMAGIEDHWCTCIPFESTDKDSDEMKSIANLVIEKMNKYLQDSVYAMHCVSLTLDHIIESNLKLDLHTDVHKNRIQEYRINFVVDPNEAEFEATFLYDTKTKAVLVDVTEISRLNRYAEDSTCVDDNIVKKYCICSDNVREKADD